MAALVNDMQAVRSFDPLRTVTVDDRRTWADRGIPSPPKDFPSIHTNLS